MSSKELVLVTGASGFLGAHIVDHLLKAGYAVRGTSRSGKADVLRRSYSTADFQVAIIDDIVTGDFTEALKGVSFVVHAASPLASPDVDVVGMAVEGTTNVLKQAYAKNIRKFVLISSVASTSKDLESDLRNFTRNINAEDWNTMTAEDARKPDVHPMKAYAASKGLAEKAAWEFAESHPGVDLTTLLPPFLYGPLAPAQVIPKGRAAESLGTNGWIYMLISGPEGEYPPSYSPHTVDVRDVAKAAVLALEKPPAPFGERKRILISGEKFRWKEAVRYLAQVRPDLKGRLLDGGAPGPEETPTYMDYDNSRAKEVLGFSERIGWKKSVLDTVNSLLEREPVWSA